MAGPVNAFKCGLAELYKSGDFTDFEIICGDQTFKVHKAILSARTKHFRNCEKFAEGDAGCVKLKAISENGEDSEDDASSDDPGAIKLMIDYFYHFDYDAAPIMVVASPMPQPEVPQDEDVHMGGFDPWHGRKVHVAALKKKKGRTSVFGISHDPPPSPQPVQPRSSNMVMHARVFAAATKYNVPALQDLSALKYAGAVEKNWNHDSFAEAASIAYNTTPHIVRALRDITGKALHNHKTLLDKAGIEKVVKANSDLQYELLRMARGLPAVVPTKVDEVQKCHECGGLFYVSRCSDCDREYRGCCGRCESGGCWRAGIRLEH